MWSRNAASSAVHDVVSAGRDRADLAAPRRQHGLVGRRPDSRRVEARRPTGDRRAQVAGSARPARSMARTSKPPPKPSRSLNALDERAGRRSPDDEREHDEREHRERDAGAEAAAQRVRHRHPQRPARGPATRPSEPLDRAEQDVGVVHDRPRRADDDHQPGRGSNIEKSIFRSPNSQRSIGSSEPARRARARPTCRRAGRARRRARAIGTRPRTTSRTPKPSVMAFCARDARRR